MLPTICFPVGAELIVHQIIGIIVPQEHDVATAAAIATAGATPWLILFTAEGRTSTSTIARLYFNYAFINKHAAHRAQSVSLAKRAVP